MHESMLKKLDQLQNRINEIQDLLLDSKTIEDIENLDDHIIKSMIKTFFDNA